MPKILTITPTEGETTEDFATRAAGQISAFFDEPAPETPPAEEVLEDVEATEPTDVSAEPAQIEEQQAPKA